MTVNDPRANGWKPVVFAAEVGPDGFCPACEDVDYGDCPCPGPSMDGYEYENFDGDLFARPVIERDQ